MGAKLLSGNEANSQRATLDQSITLDGLRILVVDDDPDSRDLLSFILETGGAEVTTVGSSREALEFMKQQQPDVLLSDIKMPEEDGYTLIRKVRTLGADGVRQTPAIAISALVGDENRRLTLAAGFQKYVPKPIEPDELIMMIAVLVGRVDQADQAD